MCLMELGQGVLKTLNEAGYEAYFVGGMVRDQLLNRPIYDVDITTSATPDQVMALFEKTIPTGLQHGTVTVIINHTPVEITTFRTETTYVDYRRPNEVFFTHSLEEDLKRRDFTMNAIAKDLKGQLYDPYEGLNDLANHCIRAVGNPSERFEEDPLRMLRAIRFMSKLNFTLYPNTYEAIKIKAPLIAHISKERIKKELDGMMSGNYKQDAIMHLIETKLVHAILGFESMLTYKTYSFERLSQGIELFIIMALHQPDIEAFLLSWPLSREEKRIIKQIVELIIHPQSDAMILYRYHGDVYQHYHHVRQFLSQTQAPVEEPILPIRSRKELAINGAAIQKVIGLPSGAWISHVLEHIEEQIIKGSLVNEKSAIESYLKTMKIGE